MAARRYDGAKSAPAPTAEYLHRKSEVSDYAEDITGNPAPMAPATAAAPVMMPPAGAERPMAEAEERSKETELAREKNLKLNAAAQKDSPPDTMEWKVKNARQNPQNLLTGPKEDEFLRMLNDVERGAIVAQNQPNRAPAKQPARQDVDGEGMNQQAARSNTKLGLLSLAIDLAAPSGSLEKSFRYAGADPSRGGIGLQLGYVDEQSGTNLRVCLMALLALIGWFLRSTSCANKVALAVLGLTIPLALLPLAPQSLQVVLDGVFFGVLIACGLWLAVGVAQPWLQQESLMKGFVVSMPAFETL